MPDPDPGQRPKIRLKGAPQEPIAPKDPENAACIDVVVQQYQKSEFLFIYVRPATFEIKEYLINMRQPRTYMFENNDVAGLAAKVNKSLIDMQSLPEVLLEGTIGKAVLQCRDQIIPQGVVQMCYCVVDKEEIENRIGKLEK